MEVSKTVDYVMNEASVEAKRGMKRFISQEHIFLGILKLTEITASDITGGLEDSAQALNREISELKQLFEQTFEIRIEHMTQILRLETMLSRKVVPADTDALQNRAKEIAGIRGSSVCCAVDLLNVILENPPETLRAAMRIERWKDRSSEWPHGTVYVEEETDGTVYEEEETDGTVYEEEETDGTVYEEEESDGTVYEEDESDSTVYEEYETDGTVYEGDETDGTVYEEYETDGTVYEGGETDATVYGEDAPAASNKDIKKDGIVLERYRILSDAIEGGMGSVWRVHHTSWDVDLAMKRPKPAFFVSEKQKESFIRECDSWIRLGLHPNIVSCYYVRLVEGIPTIFSEWMENGSLENHINDGSLYEGSDDEVSRRLLNIAIQFARGLHYAHENELIHQDVKPDNLLLTENWGAKVSDFGLAKARSVLTASKGEGMVKESDPGSTIITPSGGMTPAYCSPEQSMSKTLSRRTDIYSWAVSILEMYLGGKPWAHGRELTGPMVGSVCYEYFEMCRVPVPDRLQKLLARCMAQDPDDRYHDFAKIEIALKEIYRMEVGEEYDLPYPKAAGTTADSLNNMALSYLDLGKPEEALRLWKMALKEDPGNTRALYNYCLYSLREDLLTPKEGVCYLSANWENYFSKPEPGVLLARFSMEAGEWDVAYQVRNYLDEESRDLIDTVYDSDENYIASYELSLIRSIIDYERFQKKCDDKIDELRGYLDRGEYGEAAREMLISRMSGEYRDAVFGTRWLEINDRLAKKCFPMQVIAHWPVAVIEGAGEEDEISFSKNSALFLYGDRLYDTDTWEQLADYGDGSYVTSEISPDGKFYLRAVRGEKLFYVIEADTGKILGKCEGVSREVIGLKISRDGQLFASILEDGRIGFWNSEGFLLKEREITDERIRQVEISYDDTRALVLSQRHFYLIHIFEDRSEELTLHNGRVRMTCNTLFTRVVLACHSYGLISIDLETKEIRQHSDPVAMQRGFYLEYPQRVCYMPNDQFVLVANREDLYFYDPVNDRVLSVIHTPEYIDDICISGNGKYVAIKREEKTYIWQCMYAYTPSPTEWSDRLLPYVEIASRANPDADVSEIMDAVSAELSDRGFGNIPAEILLEKVEEIHAW